MQAYGRGLVPVRGPRPRLCNGHVHRIDDPDSGRGTHLNREVRLLMGMKLLAKGGFGNEPPSAPSLPRTNPKPITLRDEEEDDRLEVARITGKWMSVADARQWLRDAGRR